MKHLIGNSDILFLTLDTLRFDAAQQAWMDGRLKTLAPYLGSNGWEKRHTPGSFTYSAHHAFFAGFVEIHGELVAFDVADFSIAELLVEDAVADAEV